MNHQMVQSNFQFLLFFCLLPNILLAQNVQAPSLNIGDPAPPLCLGEWIKGKPIKQFEKEKIYVVEFWATWCEPCKAAMAELSKLAETYKDKVIVLAINVYERENTPIKKIKTLVDSMGNRMNFDVAIQDSNFMATTWLSAAGETDKGIPRTFVVNADGNLGWIGHPINLAKVLSQIVKNDWDVKAALAEHNLQKRLEYEDIETNYKLKQYGPQMTGASAKPDSAILMINAIIGKEPRLKYAPYIAFNTFSLLLRKNARQAYEYGKAAINTRTYDDPPSKLIIGAIESYSDKLKLPLEIYELGAQAYQVEIDNIPYPEIIDMYKLYSKKARMYWLAKAKTKAINTQLKAIEVLKNKKKFPKKTLMLLETQLEKYRKM